MAGRAGGKPWREGRGGKGGGQGSSNTGGKGPGNLGYATLAHMPVPPPPPAGYPPPLAWWCPQCGAAILYSDRLCRSCFPLPPLPTDRQTATPWHGQLHQ